MKQGDRFHYSVWIGTEDQPEPQELTPQEDGTGWTVRWKGKAPLKVRFDSKDPADHDEWMIMEIQMDSLIANALREHQETAQRMDACRDIIRQAGASIIQTIHSGARI